MKTSDYSKYIKKFEKDFVNKEKRRAIDDEKGYKEHIRTLFGLPFFNELINNKLLQPCECDDGSFSYDEWTLKIPKYNCIKFDLSNIDYIPRCRISVLISFLSGPGVHSIECKSLGEALIKAKIK